MRKLGFALTTTLMIAIAVLIYSPFTNAVDVTRFLNMIELKDALNRGIKVKVIIRPPKKEMIRKL